MERNEHIRATALGILLVAFVGCGSPKHQAEDLVLPLTKLAESAQGIVSFGAPAAHASEETLLTEALKGKPELQQAFKNVKIRLRCDDNNVVVLICSADGKCAWLETAGWKPLDVKKHYLTNPPPPAVFTIDVPKQEPTKQDPAQTP